MPNTLCRIPIIEDDSHDKRFTKYVSVICILCQVRCDEPSQSVLAPGGEAAPARAEPLAPRLQRPLRDPDRARGPGDLVTNDRALF